MRSVLFAGVILLVVLIASAQGCAVAQAQVPGYDLFNESHLRDITNEWDWRRHQRIFDNTDPGIWNDQPDTKDAVGAYGFGSTRDELIARNELDPDNPIRPLTADELLQVEAAIADSERKQRFRSLSILCGIAFGIAALVGIPCFIIALLVAIMMQYTGRREAK